MSHDLAERVAPSAPKDSLRVPTAAEWAAMTEAERTAAEQRICLTLNADISAMSESTRHFRSKNRAFNDLDDYFDGTGRRVFLACELAVLYPGEDAFAPDLLAVLDVADPQRDRDSWRVADENRGIDFILELRNKGRAQKDLRDNLVRFARLGIPEYFAYDCRNRVLRAWRVAAPGATEYTPMLPRAGRFSSTLLDLELAVIEGRLRFFIGNALIPSARERISQLQQMADDRQQAIEEAERHLEEAEQKREAAEQKREETEHQLVAERVLVRILERALPVTEPEKAAIRSCRDHDRLLDWLEQARTVASVAELHLISPDPPAR